MSMTQELISAVMNAERQIDDQMMKLRSYAGEIERVTERVDSALSGSKMQYSQQMLTQLSLTSRQVNDTLNRLQFAKDKLARVRII